VRTRKGRLAKETRQKEAKQRDDWREQLSTKEQLVLIKGRRGESKKEVARLLKEAQ